MVRHRGRAVALAEIRLTDQMLTRWLRRLAWGFNPYYCACGHHKAYHWNNYNGSCWAGFCSCCGFIPETTIRNQRGVQRLVEQQSDESKRSNVARIG